MEEWQNEMIQEGHYTDEIFVRTLAELLVFGAVPAVARFASFPELLVWHWRRKAVQFS